MSGTFDPIRDLIKKHADEPRPWRPAVVEDVSGWAADGAAMLGVRVGADFRQAAYRDGRQPLIGETVYVSKVDAGNAPYVALPLPGEPDVVIVRPNSCLDSIYYLVGRDVGTAAYRILRFASLTGIGDAWSDIAACPAAAVGGFEPELLRVTASDEYAKPWHGFPDGVIELDTASFSVRFLCYARGGELSYSDDLCATWTGTGLSPLHVARAAYYGRMYACTASAIWESADYGATWTAIPDSAPPAGSWVFVASPDQKDGMQDDRGNADDFGPGGFLRVGNTMPDRRYRGAIQAVSSTGIWYTINSFAHYAYPVEADPPFDATDIGTAGPGDRRGWNDPGSDEGEWTVTSYIDIGFGPIPWTWAAPFVTTKVYRDSYGPFGAAVDPTDAFYTGIDSGSQDAWVRPSVSEGYLLQAPANGDLEDTGDPYDTGSPKAGVPWLPFAYGSEAAHVNEQSTSREPYLCVDTSDSGGVVIAHGAYNSPYTNDTNHPYFQAGIGVLDACNCATGSFPSVANCFLVALDDETEGEDHASFVIAGSIFYLGDAPPWGAGSFATAAYTDVTTTMRHDLGAYYVGTRNGIAAYSPVRDLGGA